MFRQIFLKPVTYDDNSQFARMAMSVHLGLASYYRRFIADFAKVASPLHALTKKNVEFLWTPECRKAFEQLKKALVTAPVLSYPIFGPDQEFILETDASGVGLGAVLSQKQDGHIHPIAYASRTLDVHEKKYGITELETVWAVKYFRPYILGHRTTVYTDHAACTSLLNTPHPSGKLARWALAIQEMNLVIKHKSGKQMLFLEVLLPLCVLLVHQPHFLRMMKMTCLLQNSVRFKQPNEKILHCVSFVSISNTMPSQLMRKMLKD